MQRNPPSFPSETKYFSSSLTKEESRTIQTKIQAALDVHVPTTLKQFGRFLGIVLFYRDTWKCHSYTLAPLTDLVCKV